MLFSVAVICGFLLMYNISFCEHTTMHFDFPLAHYSDNFQFKTMTNTAAMHSLVHVFW